MAATVLQFPLRASNDNLDDTPPPAPVALTAALRRRIEATVDSLIAVLDADAGDCDLEDDDPSGDHVDEFGEVEDWRGILLPVYALDQSAGPINEREAYEAFKAAEYATPCAIREQEMAARRAA